MIKVNQNPIFLHRYKYSDDIQEINNSIGWDDCIEGIGFTAKTTRNGKVIAYLTVKPITAETLQISYLAVHREHQKLGVGKSLFAQAVKWARTENFSSIALSCEVHKVGDFYEKQAKNLNLSLNKSPGGHYPNGELASRFNFTLNKEPSCAHFFSKFRTF